MSVRAYECMSYEYVYRHFGSPTRMVGDDARGSRGIKPVRVTLTGVVAVTLHAGRLSAALRGRGGAGDAARGAGNTVSAELRSGACLRAAATDAPRAALAAYGDTGAAH